MLEVILGISAAAFYGAADFCGGLATRRTAMLAVTVLSQFAGLIVLLAILPLFPGRLAPEDFVWAALAGVCSALGIALLYHAL